MLDTVLYWFDLHALIVQMLVCMLIPIARKPNANNGYYEWLQISMIK